MSSFSKDPTPRTPFRNNEYLRSTKDVKTNSHTFAKGAIPTITVDGDVQKVLQPGTVLAKITSGPDTGKVGVYQPTTPTDGRQTAANIVGVVDTFLPWQLLERDVEVAVVYEATVVQAWCIEYNAAGALIALTNTTRDAILALPGLALLFQ